MTCYGDDEKPTREGGEASICVVVVLYIGYPTSTLTGIETSPCKPVHDIQLPELLAPLADREKYSASVSDLLPSSRG